MDDVDKRLKVIFEIMIFIRLIMTRFDLMNNIMIMIMIMNIFMFMFMIMITLIALIVLLFRFEHMINFTIGSLDRFICFRMRDIFS